MRIEEEEGIYQPDPSQSPEQIESDYYAARREYYASKFVRAMWTAAFFVALLVALVVLGRLGLWLEDHVRGAIIGFVLVGLGIGWGWRE